MAIYWNRPIFAYISKDCEIDVDHVFTAKKNWDKNIATRCLMQEIDLTNFELQICAKSK